MTLSNRLRRSNGFSLIEVVVAIAILAVLSVGVMQLFAMISKKQAEVSVKLNLQEKKPLLDSIVNSNHNCSCQFQNVVINSKDLSQAVDINEIKYSCDAGAPTLFYTLPPERGPGYGSLVEKISIIGITPTGNTHEYLGQLSVKPIKKNGMVAFADVRSPIKLYTRPIGENSSQEVVSACGTETPPCETPGHQTLKDGEKIRFFKNAKAPDCMAESEERVCQNGYLTGSFMQQECHSTDCKTPWNEIIHDGRSVTAFLNAKSTQCNTNKESRECKDGNLLGTFQNQNCFDASCDSPWGGAKISDGQSITAYASKSSEHCSDIQESRVCVNGKLTGSFTSQSCSNTTCQLPWGGEVKENDMVEAYSAPVSNICDKIKEKRYCKTGYLSGSYRFQNCTLKGCTSPVTSMPIAEGDSVTLYKNRISTNCEAEKEIRTCNNGILSGSASNMFCMPDYSKNGNNNNNNNNNKPRANCVAPWGTPVADGSSVIAYVGPFMPCQSQIRICNNGTLSGYYFYDKCGK